MFQVQPWAKATPCPAGRTCCDYWRAQTGHSSMQVGMADGSAKSLSPSIAPVIWASLLKPDDAGSVDGAFNSTADRVEPQPLVRRAGRGRCERRPTASNEI